MKPSTNAGSRCFWSYDPNLGYVNYYGDNKSITKNPESAGGSKILLEMLKYFNCDSKADWMNHCIPIIIIEKVSVDGSIIKRIRTK